MAESLRKMAKSLGVSLAPRNVQEMVQYFSGLSGLGISKL